MGKFNKVEYTNFMNRTQNQAVAVEIEKMEQRSSYRQHHSQREQNDGNRGTKPCQCGDRPDCRNGQKSR